MTASLSEPVAIETTLANRLEQQARDLIQQRDRASVANALGLAEVGVETLLWKHNWSLQRALRVLDALGALNSKLIVDVLHAETV